MIRRSSSNLEKKGKEESSFSFIFYWISFYGFLAVLPIMNGVVRLLIALVISPYSAWILAWPCVWLVKYFKARSERKREQIERERPCFHGVAGAAKNYVLCSACKQSVDDKAAECDRKAKEEAALQERERDHQASERQRQYEEWKARVRLPEYLKSVHPRIFESHVCSLYGQLGYETELTPYSGDGGVDVYLRRDGKLFLVQCKRVKGSVGAPVLRELYGLVIAEKATRGIVVTTGNVSKQARAWARNKQIEIVELEQLTLLFQEAFPEKSIVPDGFRVPDVFEVPEKQLSTCPRCGLPLRIVNGRRGKFVGCTGYPACRFTKNYNTIENFPTYPLTLEKKSDEPISELNGGKAKEENANSKSTEPSSLGVSNPKNNPLTMQLKAQPPGTIIKSFGSLNPNSRVQPLGVSPSEQVNANAERTQMAWSAFMSENIEEQIDPNAVRSQPTSKPPAPTKQLSSAKPGEMKVWGVPAPRRWWWPFG